MSNDTTNSPSSASRVGLYLRGAVLFLLVGLIFWAIRSIGVEQLQQIVERVGWWGPVVYMLLRAFAGFAAPFSSGPLQLASGILFGFVPAVIYSVLGSTLGYSVSFGLARRYGRPIVVRLAGEGAMGRVDEIIQRLDTVRGMATARLALYFAYDLVAYAAGLSRTRVIHFLWITALLGIPPIAGTIAFGLAAAGDTTWLPF